MKKVILIIISIIILMTILITITPGIRLTGDSILNNYTHTMAICDKKNYCEDYEIQCNNNKFVRMTPTGFFVQHSENWQDPRPEIEYC